jgi:serine/threonine protein kinase
MTIVAADWKRLSPLLDQALDLAPAERAAWMAALPPQDADLRDSLNELLAGRRAVETDDFLNRLPEFSAVPSALSLGPDSIVGPYRLLRELGSGGTASVWLAERVDGTIQRKVALKLPHLGLVDRGIAERIARERDILAGLEHPNIARLYDAGVDERGRPYMALEYVDGLPPDEYCRAERLELRAKLRLFLNMLRAVAFAHARLIVHRDLKPNNILIASDREVRLLDFGIARLMQADAAMNAKATMVGAAALTPAYAAPEQFTGQAVTVATDVYSLGVILYEMLTGVSPYSPAGNSLGAYEHEVLHVEPQRLSRVARPSEVAALRGDLDAIVAKALEKKPADRYASVEAFASDIERHLAAEPIAARPQSFVYVTRKFLRRNAVAVSLGTAFVLILSVALGVAAWQWRDADKQRAMAVERLANSQAAANFTSTVLIEGMQPGESLSFEDLISRSEEIARQTGQNDVRTRIFATDFLSSWYRSNGLYRKAEAILTSTIDALPPGFESLSAPLRCSRAEIWGQLGRGDEALAALTHEIEHNIADDAIAAQCLVARSYFSANSGDAKGALEYGLRAQRRFDAAGVDNLYGRVEVLVAIGAGRGLSGEFNEAHKNYSAALQLLAAAGRPRGRAAANLHDEWSSLWLNGGNPLRALEEIDTGHAILRELAPNANPDDDRRNYRRARILAQLARYDEAMSELQTAEAIAGSRGNLVTAAGVQVGEAEIMVGRGDLVASARLLDAAQTKLLEAKLPANHVLITREVMTRASLYAAQQRRADARRLFTQAIEAYEAKSCCRAQIAFALAQRGELAAQEGDLSEAEADAKHARELAPPAHGEFFSRFTGRAWFAIGLVYEQQRKLREAREAYATAAMQYAGSLGDTHPDTLLAREALARASRSLGASID